MLRDVEANLKIPSLTVKTPNEPDKKIDNSFTRFIAQIQVPAIPKPGTSLTLTTQTGVPFECEVIRSDWSEEKERFVVYCKYSKRSISPADYAALINDPGWLARPLLS